jgi:hypothetical protein
MEGDVFQKMDFFSILLCVNRSFMSLSFLNMHHMVGLISILDFQIVNIIIYLEYKFIMLFNSNHKKINDKIKKNVK